MTQYRTNNPLGSMAPKDLFDNAQNVDNWSNGEEPFYEDRFGVMRRSFSGMNFEFEAAQEGRENTFTLSQADKESRFQAFLVSSGYVDIGPYAAGVEFTARNQYVAVDGQLYRPSAATAMPYVATGDWLTESENFVLLGDDVLRQELAGDGGAAMIGRGVVAVDSIADMLALPSGQRREDLRYLVKGYHAASDIGGGEFWYDPSRAGENDGGSVLDGFVRIIKGCAHAEDFGAKGAGADDTIALQSAAQYQGRVALLGTYRSTESIEFTCKSVEGRGVIEFDLSGNDDGCIVNGPSPFNIYSKRISEKPAALGENFGDAGGNGILVRKSFVSDWLGSEGFANAVSLSAINAAEVTVNADLYARGISRGVTLFRTDSDNDADVIPTKLTVNGNLTAICDGEYLSGLESVQGLNCILVKWPSRLVVNGNTYIEDPCEHGAYAQGFCDFNGNVESVRTYTSEIGDGFKISCPDQKSARFATTRISGELRTTGYRTGVVGQYNYKDLHFGSIDANTEAVPNTLHDVVSFGNVESAWSGNARNINIGSIRIRASTCRRMIGSTTNGSVNIGSIDAECSAIAAQSIYIDSRAAGAAPSVSIGKIVARVESVGGLTGLSIGPNIKAGSVSIGYADIEGALLVNSNANANLTISSGPLHTGAGIVAFSRDNKSFTNANLGVGGGSVLSIPVANNARLAAISVNLTEQPVSGVLAVRLLSGSSTVRTISIQAGDFVNGVATVRISPADAAAYGWGDKKLIGCGADISAMTVGNTATPIAIHLITE